MNRGYNPENSQDFLQQIGQAGTEHPEIPENATERLSQSPLLEQKPDGVFKVNEKYLFILKQGWGAENSVMGIEIPEVPAEYPTIEAYIIALLANKQQQESFVEFVTTQTWDADKYLTGLKDIMLGYRLNSFESYTEEYFRGLKTSDRDSLNSLIDLLQVVKQDFFKKLGEPGDPKVWAEKIWLNFVGEFAKLNLPAFKIPRTYVEQSIRALAKFNMSKSIQFMYAAEHKPDLITDEIQRHDLGLGLPKQTKPPLEGKKILFVGGGNYVLGLLGRYQSDGAEKAVNIDPRTQDGKASEPWTNIVTKKAYFKDDTAIKLVEEFGNFDVLTIQNVFDAGSVDTEENIQKIISAIPLCLSEKGLAIIQSEIGFATINKELKKAGYKPIAELQPTSDEKNNRGKMFIYQKTK